MPTANRCASRSLRNSGTSSGWRGSFTTPRHCQPDRTTSVEPPREAGRAERRRVRKWSKYGLIAILVYSLYPVSVTLALSTGLVERLLASEDLRVEITAP